MPTEVEAKRAEEMISRWLEYNSRWMELDGTPITFDRSYVLDYRLNSMPIDPESVDVHGDTVVVIYMALDDELNNATLLAVFTDGDMRYLTAEVDTSWLDVWHQGEGYRHLPST